MDTKNNTKLLLTPARAIHLTPDEREAIRAQLVAFVAAHPYPGEAAGSYTTAPDQPTEETPPSIFFTPDSPAETK